MHNDRRPPKHLVRDQWENVNTRGLEVKLISDFVGQVMTLPNAGIVRTNEKSLSTVKDSEVIL